MNNMKAKLIIDTRQVVSENAFVELLVWEVPNPVRASLHYFKYGLAFVVEGHCVLRYDNEAGKGDHKHIGETEVPYTFVSPQQLLADFWNDVDNWRP